MHVLGLGLGYLDLLVQIIDSMLGVSRWNSVTNEEEFVRFCQFAGFRVI